MDNDEYVVMDEVSGTLIGPFVCKEDAESFLAHISSDVMVAGGQPEFTVIAITPAGDWALDNAVYA